MIEVTQYLHGPSHQRYARFVVEAPFWTKDDYDPDWSWFIIAPILKMTEADESFDCVTLKHYHPVL
jgi:hypothetical protein